MELLIAIAAAVAGVWALWYALRGSLVAGCLVFLLVATCFGSPFLHFETGLLPGTLDRLLILGLIAAYCLQRALGRTDPKPLELSDKALLALLAWLTFSTFTHNWRNLAPGIVPPVWRLITGYFFPAALYWIARQSRLFDRRVKLVHASLGLFGVYLAVTGLAEVSRQWWLVFPRYIADPLVGLHYGRARGPMVQAVSYGFALGVTALAGLVWRSYSLRWHKLAWLAIVPIELAALYYTYTRSIWIGTTVLTVIVLAATLRGAWRPMLVATLITAALFMTISQLDSVTSLKREGNATEARESATMRACFAYVSWQMFLDRPLFGFGFGQFYQEKLAYLSDRTTPLELELIRDYIHHNTYLDLLTETGLVGLSLFLIVLSGWIRTAWRLSREENPLWVRAHGVLMLGALGTYAVQMMFHEVSYTVLDNGLLFFLAGIAAGLAPQFAAARSTDCRGLALPTTETGC